MQNPRHPANLWAVFSTRWATANSGHALIIIGSIALMINFDNALMINVDHALILFATKACIVIAIALNDIMIVKIVSIIVVNDALTVLHFNWCFYKRSLTRRASYDSEVMQQHVFVIVRGFASPICTCKASTMFSAPVLLHLLADFCLLPLFSFTFFPLFPLFPHAFALSFLVFLLSLSLFRFSRWSSMWTRPTQKVKQHSNNGV